jgi:hypothetical protein
VLPGMGMQGSSLYIPRWSLHRRDVKTATKWSLEEDRPDRGTPENISYHFKKKFPIQTKSL